eukprot:3150270-Lingulodinium_polyedra.AAC.1
MLVVTQHRARAAPTAPLLDLPAAARSHEPVVGGALMPEPVERWLQARGPEPPRGCHAQTVQLPLNDAGEKL